MHIVTRVKIDDDELFHNTWHAWYTRFLRSFKSYERFVDTFTYFLDILHLHLFLFHILFLIVIS